MPEPSPEFEEYPAEEYRDAPGLLRRSPILSGLAGLGLLGLVGHVVLGPSVVPPAAAGAGLLLAAVAGVGLWLASRRRRRAAATTVRTDVPPTSSGPA